MNPMQEFIDMVNLAELKALSKVSLERQLTEKEYQQMMYLKDKVLNI